MKIQSIYQSNIERGRASRMSGVVDDDEEDEEQEDELSESEDKFPLNPVEKPPEYDDDGNLIDHEALEEQKHIEDVKRWIMANEDNNPEKACLEKIMRFRIRFRVDSRKLPFE
jgi:hypothetical protein